MQNILAFQRSHDFLQDCLFIANKFYQDILKPLRPYLDLNHQGNQT